MTTATGIRLRAQWRQTERENADAQQARREWMTLLGCHENEIRDICEASFDLDLIDELEQLARVKSLMLSKYPAQ